MITRAIVEEVMTPHKVRIRIPILDRLSYSPMSSDTQDLNIATICSLPNCYMNVQVGDVVFIGFEDNTYYKAVILGHLSRDAMSDTYSDVTFGNVIAKSTATLPHETSIGEVTSFELSCLTGIKDNLQKQIDSLTEKIDTLSGLLTGGNN